MQHRLQDSAGPASLRGMVYASLFGALTAVGAFIIVPIPPVPIVEPPPVEPPPVEPPPVEPPPPTTEPPEEEEPPPVEPPPVIPPPPSVQQPPASGSYWTQYCATIEQLSTRLSITLPTYGRCSGPGR